MLYSQRGTSLLAVILAGALGLLLGLGGGYLVRTQTNPLSNNITQSGIGGGPNLSGQNGISQKELDLRQTMRKLWVEHIAWTRMWVVSFANANGDTDAVTSRLLRNQDEIGNAVKPYYGTDAGNKLTSLLREHIFLAVDVVKAAKAGDDNVLNTANDKWYANANQIADFLASANSNWSDTELRNMMKTHLDLTKQEAVDILNKNYAADITDYDNVQIAMLNMSDTLSQGIVKQFPDKF